MGMSKIKKGDTVQVLTGKDKGRVGTVLRVVSGKQYPTKHGIRVLANRVVVEGINLVTKHLRAKGEQHPGQIERREASLAISNVALYNPETKKTDKVAAKILENGKKIRVYKSSGEPIYV